MSFSFKRTITIDHTKVPNTDQTNFPVLVSVTDATLKSVGNSGHVQSSSGYDIGFYADSGAVTKLDWEVQKYDETTGELVAWVRIPTVATASDTVFYLFYGDASISSSQANPTGVWDSHFKAVWHVSEGSGTTAADSTSGGRTLSISGSGFSWVDGKITKALLGTAAGYLHNTDTTLLASSAEVTIEAWFNSGNNYAGAAVLGQWNSNGYMLYFPSTTDLRMYVGGSTSDYASFPASDSTWHHLVGTYNSAGAEGETIYVDGSVVGGAGGSASITSASQEIEAFAYAGGFGKLPAALCELRISDIARSPYWIATEYNNQSSPGTFSTLGSESPTSISVSVNLSSVAASSAVGSFTVTAGSTVSLSGLAASSAIGTLTNTASASISLSGVAAGSGVGSTTVTGGANASCSGLGASPGVGTMNVTAGASASPAGVAAQAGVGTASITAGSAVAITGAAASAGVGTVIGAAVDNALCVGVSASPGAGVLDATGTCSVTITGVSAVAAVGSVAGTILFTPQGNIAGRTRATPTVKTYAARTAREKYRAMAVQ